MRIVVTERDIVQAAIDKAAGRPLSLCCPIAQSLTRRGFRNAGVTPARITWFDGSFHEADTPPVAAEWIDKYDDNHHHVGPFSFELGVQP